MTSSALMEKTVGPAANIPVSKKTSARVAFVDLKEPARAILSDCFRQFGMESVAVVEDVPVRMKKEKFEACVLRLSPETQPVLESARSSASNSRMVIYGLGGSLQEVLRYSKYGINAVFQEPLERPAALKLVRATRMLVFHEFRRYVRIPVITEIALVTHDNHRFNATSKELSCGGMSMTSNEEISIGSAVEVSFALLTLPRLWVRGNVSWRKPNKTFGVRFDPADNRRLRIKDWVEAYLES